MGVFDELKTVVNVLQEAGKAKELQQLLNVQKELLEMQNKIKEQDDEIRDLREKFQIKNKIIFEKNAYWIQNKDGSKEGPYCSACWDNDTKQLIHLHSVSGVPNAFRCPVCKNGVRTDSTSASSDSSPQVIPRDDNSW